MEIIIKNFIDLIEPNKKHEYFVASEIFHWLTQWYVSNCNEDWEHSYGISIKTLDNPGWMVDIDLWDTEIENEFFEKVFLYNNEKDWLFCKVENNVFKGRGDLDKLEQILEIFKNWQECLTDRNENDL